MKARIGSILVFALLFSAQGVFAQSTPAGGVFVGVNQSYFSTQPKNETEAKQGLVAGVFGVLRRDKAIKVQGELQYSQRRVDVAYANVFQTHVNSVVSGIAGGINIKRGMKARRLNAAYTMQW